MFKHEISKMQTNKHKLHCWRESTAASNNNTTNNVIPLLLVLNPHHKFKHCYFLMKSLQLLYITSVCFEVIAAIDFLFLWKPSVFAHQETELFTVSAERYGVSVGGLTPPGSVFVVSTWPPWFVTVFSGNSCFLPHFILKCMCVPCHRLASHPHCSLPVALSL